jgi:NAD(P)-dependent dehydrogenase (short-subunit alcohol dehydrogenase family)
MLMSGEQSRAMRLKGKVAIVTGTSSGIGIGIAEVFAEEGARVACVARRKKEGEAVAQSLRDRGAEALFIPCDVSDGTQVDEMVQRTLDAFGRIDVLVNNAGVDIVRAFDELTVEDWDRVIGVDLRGTFLCTKACIGHFLARGSGNVVNITSVHTLASLPGAAPYDAAKWGMVGLTKSLAVEYAARGIRFNCLSPGLIDTQMWQDIQEGAEDLDACLTHWRANIPAGRVGTAREMGHVAAFLASDEASYITGANLLADGGMTSQLVSKALYASKPLQRQ